MKDADTTLTRAFALTRDIHERGVILRTLARQRYGGDATVDAAVRRRLVRTTTARSVVLLDLGSRGRVHVGLSRGARERLYDQIAAHTAQRLVIDATEAAGGEFVQRIDRSLLHLRTADGDNEFALLQHTDYQPQYLATRVARLRALVYRHHGTLVIYRYAPLSPSARVHREVLVQIRPMQPLLDAAHPDARVILLGRDARHA